MIKLEHLNCNEENELQSYAYYTNKLYEYISNDAKNKGFEFNERYTVQNLKQDILNKSREFFWVKINNDICGLVAIRHMGDMLKISSLYIKEEYRNKGIATNCISKLIDTYGKSLTLDLYYDGKAKELYKKLGFKNKYSVMELKIK